MIKTENLTFSYKEGEVILENMNLTIEKGSFTAVVGSNGSGKSTLAKLFNAILLPSGGKVYVNGTDTLDSDKLFLIKKSAGMVFQNPDNQIVCATVEEDIAFAPENLCVPSDEIRLRVKSCIDTVGLQGCEKRPPSQLSGGQKQRLAIASILAMEPECIILDEPTSMLDPMGRNEVTDALIRINREKNITIILITHYMEEAARADRVIVTNGGKIIADGAPGNVFSQMNMLNSAGLELPAAAKLSHELISRGINMPPGIITADECVNAILSLFGGIGQND